MLLGFTKIGKYPKYITKALGIHLFKSHNIFFRIINLNLLEIRYSKEKCQLFDRYSYISKQFILLSTSSEPLKNVQPSEIQRFGNCEFYFYLQEFSNSNKFTDEPLKYKCF